MPAYTKERTAAQQPRLGQPPGKRLARPRDNTHACLTAEQRLLLLDTWRRDCLPAADAGCEDEKLLARCGSRGQHVCGCWVVDLVRSVD